MKKIMALILAIAMLGTLAGCGNTSAGSSEAPAESSENVDENEQPELTPLEFTQVTYQLLNSLAECADLVGSDICTAWHAAIWDADNVVSGGAKYLDEKLAISEDELREGIAHAAFSETDGDWDAITDEQWEELRQKDSLFAEAQEKEALFDCCINVVWAAFLESDYYDSMEEGLSQAKENIRTLQEADPDNEYVDDLKDYYGVIRSYLEWCEKPDGSYNEASERLNEYEDSYRSYRDDLEFDLGE